MSEKQFELDVDAFLKATGIDLQTVVRRVGFDVLEKAKYNTRVDTGRARGSWNITEETVNISTLPEAPNGKEGFYNASQTNVVGHISGEKDIFVTNNVEYIEFLDLKDNIVDLTVAQVEAEMQAIINSVAQ